MWNAATYFGTCAPQSNTASYICNFCKKLIPAADFRSNKALRVDHIRALSIYKFYHKDCIHKLHEISLAKA